MAKPKQGLIDVSKYPDDTEVPSFAGKAVCAKCGARGRHIDMRPNWKEQPSSDVPPAPASVFLWRGLARGSISEAVAGGWNHLIRLSLRQ